MKKNIILNNHYWFKYKDLENRVIDLSYAIHFNDDQLKVFSFHIADLMIQIASEYESIITDLFDICSDGKKCTTVGGKLLYIANVFELEKKELKIVHPNMYFKKRFDAFYAPFSYKNNSSDDIYKNYNAIKHHRTKNIKKANIKNLILALSALYIILLYYYSYDHNSINSFTSNIFEAKTAGIAIGIMLDFGVPLLDELDKCILFKCVHFDYYLFRETHYEGINKLLNEASDNIGKNSITKIVKQYQQSICATISNILVANSPNMSAGEVLNTTLLLTGNYYADEQNAARTRINRGYKYIYIPLDKMSVTTNEARKYKIADIFEI